MGTKKQKNVLLALGWYDHRLLQGIAAYAGEHHWHIAAASVTQEHVIPWGWQGDGILAWLGSGDELAEFVLSAKLPTVDFSLRRAHLPFSHVVLDHAAAAEMAADHFLQRGFRHFAFYTAHKNWTYDARGSGFDAALRARGHSCEWLKWYDTRSHTRGASGWSKRQAWLTKSLASAPKPLAIFTANGTLAVEVLEACEEAEIEVPKSVAIVGIEDDQLPSRSMLRSITTVDTNLEEQGYQGAALLDRLMDGEPAPAEPVRVPPARVITRRSTDITAVPHPGVARALRFVSENLDKSIGVDAVAKVAGMSRRGLHEAFVAHLGRTPGAHIRAVRIENAKKLLAETDSKVESIAASSGYPSLNSFFVAFKQACRTTPTEYRKEVRRAR